MESETVYAGDCLSKFQRQNVICALCVLYSVGCDFFRAIEHLELPLK